MLDWLLKYPLSDYARGSWILLAAWPVAARAAAVVGGALLLGTLAYRRRAVLPSGRWAVIAALQIAMLSVALTALWQPALVVSVLAAGENTVAILLDNSASMRFRDGERTRLQQAQAVLESAPLAQLAHRYRLRDYVFADALAPLNDYKGLPPAGQRTAIGAAVLQVLQQLHTSALGAVLVISDGADSGGALPQAMLDQIASYGVPVHTIGIGRPRMPEDLELSDVQLPSRALLGTTIVARAQIRHDGAGHTRLKVYDGERLLAIREVQLSDEPSTSVPVSFTLDQSGERELRFSLDPKPDERELRNNTRIRMVEVDAQPARVLYVEGEPRWEYKFMRRALEQDGAVRLVSLLRTSVNGYYRQGVDTPQELSGGFPTDRATLYHYDALIIGSLPAAWFRPEQLQMIRDFVSERGGSLLMLAGPSGLGDGGWGHSVVGQLLPTALPDGESFHRVRAQVLLTHRGERAPLLQLSDDPLRNAQLWAGLPPLQDYQDLGAPRLGATVLLDLKLPQGPQPLLVSQAFGRGRALIFATGGTWRWRMGLPSSDVRHQAFWRQLLRALVADVPRPFDLTATVQDGRIHIRAQLRDASFAVVSDASVRVSLSSPNELTSLPLKALVEQPGVYTVDYQPAQSGSFVLEAQAQRGGATLGSARTSLEFQQGEAEYFSLRENPALLQALAAATGGHYWSPQALTELPQAIRGSAAGVIERQVLPLWDAPLGFLLLAALKAGEWLLRRRWGVL